MNNSLNQKRLDIAIVGLIGLALFSPYMLAIQGIKRVIVAASTWSIIIIENDWMHVVPPLLALPIVFVILIPRFLYVYTIWGYYTNRNRQGDFLWGLILVLAQLLIPFIYYYFIHSI